MQITRGGNQHQCEQKTSELHQAAVDLQNNS